MQSSLDTPDPKMPWPLRALGIALLAAAGAAAGYLTANHVETNTLAWDDALALLMSALLIASAVAMVFVLISRPASVPKGCGMLQIIVLLLAGVLFLLPVLGPAYAGAELVFGLVAALLTVQTIANLMLWRAADELFRRVMLETAALTFAVGQIGLFLYAAAERLRLLPSVSAWGLMGVLMGLYLIASVIAAARRGLK